MKKWIVVIAALLVVAAVAVTLIGIPPIHSADAVGKVTWYDRQEKVFRTEELTAEETATVVQILKKSKPLPVFAAGYACGYGEELSITIDGTIYYQAQDSCGYVQDARTGRYYEISGQEHDVIDAIFRAHGACDVN